MEQPILALVDSSIYWKSVCDLAIWASRAFNVPVRLLNVLDKMSHEVAIPDDIAKDIDNRFLVDFVGKVRDETASYARLMQELGQTVLDNAKSYIERHEKVIVDTRLRYDSLADAIGFYGKTSSLIIIGKQGQQTSINDGYSKVGNNFETIVRAARKPVLAASIEVRPIKKALLLYDEYFGLNLVVDYLKRYHSIFDKPVMIAVSQNNFQLVEKDIDYIEKVSKQENIALSLLAVNEDFNEEILNNIAYENNIDLLIINAFTESKIKNMLFGSVQKILIQKIKVPILIVR